ncbi:hypothetical protein QAD02_003946 [Eretmocerus hayati]|uniref:Uncharacterized protein n=1 Tax=Eretmocerus hayati TaxID=131215 RepID=A0ACC2NPY9_9HYME|nr:hypothetical protein QAD02_003946 [Eretmocerus hayati]
MICADWGCNPLSTKGLDDCLNAIITCARHWTDINGGVTMEVIPVRAGCLYSPAFSSKRPHPKTREHKNTHRNHTSQQQATSNGLRANEATDSKESEKYQDISNQHQELLISRNGHIPNSHYGKPHLKLYSQCSQQKGAREPNQGYIRGTTDLDQDLDLRSSIKIMDEMLQKTSIEKLYKALDVIACHRNKYDGGPSHTDPDEKFERSQESKIKDQGLMKNNDDKWKLDYSAFLPRPAGTQNIETPDFVVEQLRLSETTQQQIPRDAPSMAGKVSK